MGFFNNFVNDVETIVNRFEEGISVIMNGENPDVQSDELPRQEGTGHRSGAFSDEAIASLDEDELRALLQEHENIFETSPLEGIADGVISDIMKNKAVGPSTSLEHIEAFGSAITWSESFIQCLLAFQIFMFCLCLWVSKRDRGLTVRVTVMVMIGIIVRSAEWMNRQGSLRWKHFCTQNYFDRRGIFMGVMVCGPLLFDCVIMLVFFVREAGLLLVQVKRKEIVQKQAKSSKPKTDPNTAESKKSK
ncbi:unnamed protein product [Cylindrotheca closterium]|uniref:Transmembrane protein 18 n=1 Tax=Cylindrotheca closterium TaxID=2856 RepID=A0AAD2FZS0_9STRA|nr:unnamed protein product [Cylindrotheca closterium]